MAKVHEQGEAKFTKKDCDSLFVSRVGFDVSPENSLFLCLMIMTVFAEFPGVLGSLHAYRSMLRADCDSYLVGILYRAAMVDFWSQKQPHYMYFQNLCKTRSLVVLISF
jgi:hypothetical protein